jgi:hypothetical protein
VAVIAGGSCLVFGGKIPPFLFVAQPVVTVHIPPIMDSKILRHYEQPL